MAFSNTKAYADHYLIELTAGPEDVRIRLDLFLMKKYPKKSRENLKQAIKTGQVEVSRTDTCYQPIGHLKPSLLIMPGDVVQVRTVKIPEPVTNLEFEILYEDEALFVINKPPGLPVHPAGKFYFNTLLVHLRENHDSNYHLVHRIDKDTSGILVMAKNPKYCDFLSSQFRNREVKKTYLALTHGRPKLQRFSNSTPLGRLPTSRIRIQMDAMPLEAGGLEAHTEFEVVDTSDNFSLIKCHPRTGRQHQIRVHLAQLGLPIVGDKLYCLTEAEALDFYEPNGKTYQEVCALHQEKLILDRHALHASEITLTHPISLKSITIIAPLAQDLHQTFLSDQLGSSTSSEFVQPYRLQAQPRYTQRTLSVPS
jgi:23S rRNA pseudouridine1911/1915/1917 synthase